jgi:hypothetical protein
MVIGAQCRRVRGAKTGQKMAAYKDAGIRAGRKAIGVAGMGWRAQQHGQPWQSLG